MPYFDGCDINGKHCRVDEAGNDIGFVRTDERGCMAIRIASSTYVGTDGKVYASSQEKCKSYTNSQNLALARTKMVLLGMKPEF